MPDVFALAAVSSIGGPTSAAGMAAPPQLSTSSSTTAASSHKPLLVMLERPASAAPNSAVGIADNLAMAADRWRAEFDAAQRRLISPSGQGSPLETAMNRSLQLQAEIFRVSAGFHIGLSANQQSQGAVRTLVEKS